ncbi:M20 family metallopeptidase [Paeniglutamicibacter sp. MACA_103]|uniref:M20 family metallopeptidase n=1 Tax=Paeniglutamicibacter sp. MACA_103 TaxID=3377337 RepID=UPI0038964E69
MDYLKQAARIEADLVSLRHELHRHPEVGLHLPWTQQRILDKLAELPLEVTVGAACSSVVAVLRGQAAAQGHAPAVLLRGDMDALPVAEETGLEFASEETGAMHACGHDAHMAMVLGAAELLSANRENLAGDVVFMFQPGEEGHDGARLMIEEGVLDASGTRVSAAFALHVFSARIPQGTFMVRRGAIMSASDTVLITVRGRGGHGSAPHRAADPVTAAATMVLALQTMVTRRFDSFDPVVVSIGMIRGGEVENVIPDSVEIKATVRTFSTHNRMLMNTSIPEVLGGIADAHGVEVDVDYRLLYPVTHNDPAESEIVADTVRELFGAERLIDPEYPLSASEDFSKVLDQVPGVFIPLGAARPGVDVEELPDNHSPQAVFADDVLKDGAALMATLAHRRLAALSAASMKQEATK